MKTVKNNDEILKAKVRWLKNIINRNTFDPFHVFAVYKLEKLKKHK